MKLPFPYQRQPRLVAPFTATTFSYLAIRLMVFIAVLHLAACQRRTQGYFVPMPRPAIERVVTASNATSLIPMGADLPLTASTADGVPALFSSVSSQTPATSEQASALGQLTPRLGRARRQPQHERASQRVTVPCDQIVLRSGDVIEAKVKEVGVSEIKYKKCDRQDGPDYTISKRDVLSIKYSNGEVERFSTAATPSAGSTTSGGYRPAYDSPTNGANDGPRTDPFAIVAVAAGGLAILTGYGAFLLGGAAIVFGALSLSRIRREPNRFKGKGLAIGGMVAGLLSAAAILLYILL
ncbi:DUF4190 domain-containing protein [Fibrella sp. HMF5335]|uniref:DUF4190 domain-containing protein n=1 Tax=Fibrella rubiginis TaxID=2817060 RepID=A0A939GCC5_9BACT|nr:DUF4190 domain-containing protein [Fibrella rubiginis]MBO0936462.1 DUF4190 domain-containing protein [Fibrella rubiginis]